MEYFINDIMTNIIIYVNTTNNRIQVEMEYYTNNIMNSIIYGDLDESEYENVLIHDLANHQREKNLNTNGWVLNIISLCATIQTVSRAGIICLLRHTKP